MAGERLMSISQDERERAILRSRMMYKTDLQSNLAAAEKRGVRIGEEAVEKNSLYTSLTAEGIAALDF